MNDSRDRRTKLLAEALHGDWADGPVAAMARRAAAHARRRRALRGATLTLATAAALATIVFVANRTRQLPPPTAIVVAAPTHLRYEIISDDELVALLKDRPLLVLPQENGTKKLVVLRR